MTTVKHAAIAGAVAALILSAPVLADELADGVATLPGAVEDVRIGGTWEKDGESGAYRVIIAREGSDVITARLFIQWISYDDNGGAKLDQTVEIKEFADLKLDIVDYTSDSDSDGLSLFLETLNPNNDADESYELHVISPTDYRLSPATN